MAYTALLKPHVQHFLKYYILLFLQHHLAQKALTLSDNKNQVDYAYTMIMLKVKNLSLQFH